jgi:hypothetical protein
MHTVAPACPDVLVEAGETVLPASLSLPFAASVSGAGRPSRPGAAPSAGKYGAVPTPSLAFMLASALNFPAGNDATCAVSAAERGGASSRNPSPAFGASTVSSRRTPLTDERASTGRVAGPAGVAGRGKGEHPGDGAVATCALIACRSEAVGGPGKAGSMTSIAGAPMPPPCHAGVPLPGGAAVATPAAAIPGVEPATIFSVEGQRAACTETSSSGVTAGPARRWTTGANTSAPRSPAPDVIVTDTAGRFVADALGLGSATAIRPRFAGATAFFPD